VLRKVKELLAGGPVRGFLTDEVRTARGQRVGFQIEALDGTTARLADITFRSSHQVGRYGVDLRALERVAIPTLAIEDRAVYLIDEIGKMECLSSAFVDAVKKVLESGRPAVATVAQRGAGFIAEVKQHPGAELWEVTRANRDSTPHRIISWLES
jgi:nucleoside-triphosphatase